MSEPKFTDAPCFGKQFQANSRICRVCLASKSCQNEVSRAFHRQFAAPHRRVLATRTRARLTSSRISDPLCPERTVTAPSA